MKLTLPTTRDIAAASVGQRALAVLLRTQAETQRIHIVDEQEQSHVIELPTAALRLLIDILAELANGNAVQIMPVHAQVTTQEAADLLNVSRPHFIKLLNQGVLPFHKTGKHRRVQFADVMEYKARRDADSAGAMDALAQQAQGSGMGYE
ncbi:helix-turn-helix domain-containing protein [Actimicrobium sp. CCC2.4]|uniref:helix-turn-helix domain-containing protein n=1 Tax=Actimicrobium sp. CCC2.4 TaxID=3048606 RepID=UPI002AC9761B|nr:helix-turn-helix domain-containing protein [Actimicrobium sp. CCC2.4]MEB0136063.1 helix-turn-helix domain-containing protein [Actimicrobium sp. CCC2.4]WPX32179.1 helix-turn-helix domain-containing protein [Actimicrobium sp. CCC2.4]